MLKIYGSLIYRKTMLLHMIIFTFEKQLDWSISKEEAAIISAHARVGTRFDLTSHMLVPYQ